MKFAYKTILGLTAVALWTGAGYPAQGQTKAGEVKPSARSLAATASPQSKSEAPIPQSEFRVPANASQGRNPFFPNSTMLSPQPIPPSSNSVPTLVEAVLVLNGLSGPPKRTAIINGRTFEAGEQGEVRLPSGSKILIKCEEISDKSAVFLVAGQRRELRMRAD